MKKIIVDHKANPILVSKYRRTEVAIRNEFCKDIKEFVSKYESDYRLSKDADTWWVYRRIMAFTLCDHIIKKFHYNATIYDVSIPDFGSEGDISRWFRENYYLFDFADIRRSQYQNFDYDCQYADNDIMIRLGLDERSLKFFDDYINYSKLYLTIELEYLSSNFVDHKHSAKLVDMVICYKKDKKLSVPILELDKKNLKFSSEGVVITEPPIIGIRDIL